MTETAMSLVDTMAAERILAVVRQMADDTHPERRHTVTLDTSFEGDLALDSLARVELLQRIDKALNVELPGAALSEADTPRALLHLLEKLHRLPDQYASVALSKEATAGIPDKAATLLEVLEWHAERQPDRVHLLLLDEQHHEVPISYRDLLDGARAIAGGLVTRGVLRGQTVALMLPTGRDYLISFFGVMFAGAIPVPIYPSARLANIEDHLRRHAHILVNAQVALMITVAQAGPVARMLRAMVPSLAAALTPDELAGPPGKASYRPAGGDIAFLQYTSGSTGDPKGVMLTHANLLANIRALGQAARVNASDIFVSWLPLYHDMGLIGAWFGSLYHGMPLVLMSPLAFLARPALWLQMISRHHGTISAAPNFAYELCVRHVDDATLAALDLSSWRLALNGAEPVSPVTLSAFGSRFSPCGLRPQALTPVYGLAESSVGLAFPPAGRGPRIDTVVRERFAREGKAVPAEMGGTDTLQIPSCGRPLSGHQIRIVDAMGAELPEREIGRLQFRGPSATKGYYRNPEANAKLFHDGWLDSGDDAYMAEGEVYIAGRIKDLIKRGGRSLYPYDLEQAVGALPGVRKGCVAVFPSADPGTGTERLVIMAETRAADQAERSALRHAINLRAIAVVGTPADEVILVPPHSVLKTSSGKIRRTACRQAYENGELATRSSIAWLNSARFLAASTRARAVLISRKAGGWLWGCWAWAIFSALALVCGVAIALLQRPHVGRRIAHSATRVLLRLTGTRALARRLDFLPRQAHVLLVNHASYLDAIMLTALLSPVPGYAFAAKSEFARQPLMRALLSGLGAVFIDRVDISRSTDDVALMAAALGRGERLLVFPEGTFSREAGLKSFRVGAFAAAAEAGVPLVVAGLRGTRAALRDGTWLPRPTRIAFQVGSTFAPLSSQWNAIMQVATAARAEMATLSGEFALPE